MDNSAIELIQKCADVADASLCEAFNTVVRLETLAEALREIIKLIDAERSEG